MEEWHAPPWTLSAQDEWIFSEPPYRGVLHMAEAHHSAQHTSVQARIETPEGTVPAPHPFATIKDAQVWAEKEIYRRMAEAGQERRRHGPGRREHNHT
jgi:hypothetical protein